MVLGGQKRDVDGNGDFIIEVLEDVEKTAELAFENIFEGLQTVGRATTMFLGALVGGR